MIHHHHAHHPSSLHCTALHCTTLLLPHRSLVVFSFTQIPSQFPITTTHHPPSTLHPPSHVTYHVMHSVPFPGCHFLTCVFFFKFQMGACFFYFLFLLSFLFV
ncbi:hypothetical protein KC19_12G164200 [Ceratodon purpureus]|uniref:Uncharacterized protein n=1 Tax=Ceratodon purpureus TaxID=3225 RepID=A0A8T0G7R9_CERPU|nr:hypothetical protein KC19_12G164200 [Ceratodon purpureus]